MPVISVTAETVQAEINNNKSAKKGSGKVEERKGKVSEKQARRNARRLEKKKTTAATSRV